MTDATKNFSTLAEGAHPPDWPHIVCVGDGFAWHREPRVRPCFVGEVSVDASVVALAIDNRHLPGIDRLLAIATLRESTSWTVVRRIFREKCPACGANHLELAEQAIRVVRGIVHPGAIGALRDAGVPSGLLRKHRAMPRGPESPPKDEAEAKRRARAMRYLPFVDGDATKTKAAQIAFAVQYGMRR